MKQNRITKGITVLIALLVIGLTAIGTASAALDLGTAGDFTILSNTGITHANSAGTTITGNIGTALVANPAITGISCTDVTGAITILSTAGYPGGYDANVTCRVVSNTIITNGVADMGTAYTYYSGVSVPQYANRTNELGAGTLSGEDLAPGVYKWTSAVDITGNITLNASKAGNGTQWIFQLAQTLDVESGKKIILTNGADAEDVVWAVAGATTLKTTSEFNGTILGMTSIAMQNAANLNGRALAQTAVTLISNTITYPSLTLPPPPTPDAAPAAAARRHGVSYGDSATQPARQGVSDSQVGSTEPATTSFWYDEDGNLSKKAVVAGIMAIVVILGIIYTRK